MPRFTYRRLTPDEFRAELRRADIKYRTFSRLTGADIRTVSRWLKGGPGNDIPSWVPLVLTLLTLHGGIARARLVAAQMIERDEMRQDLGAFPYASRDFTEQEDDDADT
jgi:hypothetical protein